MKFAFIDVERASYVKHETRAAATADIGEYIESFYNPVRRHSHLGYVSPIEYELKSKVAALAA